MDQPDPPGLIGRESLGAQEITPRVSRSNGSEHIRANGGREKSQPHFGETEDRRFGRHRKVAAGHQSDPAAESGTVDLRNGRFAQRIERAHHAGQAQCVLEVLCLGIPRRSAHPVQVRAGGKTFARSPQNNNAYSVVLVKFLEEVGQIRDEMFVESVANLRPVERDRGHAAGSFRNDIGRHAGSRSSRAPASMHRSRTRFGWIGSLSPGIRYTVQYRPDAGSREFRRARTLASS